MTRKIIIQKMISNRHEPNEGLNISTDYFKTTAERNSNKLLIKLAKSYLSGFCGNILKIKFFLS